MKQSRPVDSETKDLTDLYASQSVRSVAVVGSVGVPARYGGFETLAEQLIRTIPASEVSFVIYCERKRYEEDLSEHFAGHHRVFLPLRANGASSMLYDAAAVLHALIVKRVDAILVLGYSGGFVLPLARLMRGRCRLITNIDGMEWRRRKWGALSSALLRLLERCAVAWSHVVIADNPVVADLARERYGVQAAVIPYGGDHALVSPAVRTADDRLPENEFYLSVARVEPENNCHTILEAFARSGKALVFVGNWDGSAYGRGLRARYEGHPGLHLLNPIYDASRLALYRKAAVGYIHGHSVGGTNPSLVEALFWTDRIAAFDCAFNRATLEGRGRYFRSAQDLAAIVRSHGWSGIEERTLRALRDRYRWIVVARAYMHLLLGDSGACERRK